MPSKLATIAILGLVGSAVCIGAGAAIGGHDFSGLDLNMFDGSPRCEANGATATSRTLDWDGSDHAGLSIRATANYTPGVGDGKVHAEGNPTLLAHLRIKDGMVGLDCHGWRNTDRDVTITLPGRTFRKFKIAGTGKLNLNKLDQQELRVEAAGVATIKADGRVDDLRIEMAGVSKADFSKVTGRKARVEMAGVSKAEIAPTDEAHVEMAGPSEVVLHSNPKKLDTEIAGPGHVRKVED